MGQSLTVQVVYGMVLPNEYAEVDHEPEDFPFWSEDDDWYGGLEDWVERLGGIGGVDSYGGDYEEYYRLCREARKACPFDITFGGIGDWAEPVLYVKATGQTFYDGISRIDQEPRGDLDANREAREWAFTHGIPWEPEWLVVARYG